MCTAAVYPTCSWAQSTHPGHNPQPSHSISTLLGAEITFRSICCSLCLYWPTCPLCGHKVLYGFCHSKHWGSTRPHADQDCAHRHIHCAQNDILHYYQSCVSSDLPVYYQDERLRTQPYSLPLYSMQLCQ